MRYHIFMFIYLVLFVDTLDQYAAPSQQNSLNSLNESIFLFYTNENSNSCGMQAVHAVLNLKYTHITNKNEK